jgi:hypothetical protein
MERISELGTAQFLVTANVVPSSLILFTLMIEAILSYETSLLTKATLRYIPEDEILSRQLDSECCLINTVQKPIILCMEHHAKPTGLTYVCTG